MVIKIMKFLHLKLIDEYNSGKAKVELLCNCHLKTVFIRNNNSENLYFNVFFIILKKKKIIVENNVFS